MTAVDVLKPACCRSTKNKEATSGFILESHRSNLAEREFTFGSRHWMFVLSAWHSCLNMHDCGGEPENRDHGSDSGSPRSPGRISCANRRCPPGACRGQFQPDARRDLRSSRRVGFWKEHACCINFETISLAFDVGYWPGSL